MNLEIKIFATLRKYGPSETALGDSFKIKIEGDHISDVIDELKIPPDERLIVLVNGVRVINFQQTVENDDLVVFFPQLGGG